MRGNLVSILVKKPSMLKDVLSTMRVASAPEVVMKEIVIVTAAIPLLMPPVPHERRPHRTRNALGVKVSFLVFRLFSRELDLREGSPVGITIWEDTPDRHVSHHYVFCHLYRCHELSLHRYDILSRRLID